jgi:transcription antitermination factor NusG
MEADMDRPPLDNRAWFALRVSPRHDKIVALALRNNGLEECLPLYRSRRRWSDRFKMVDLPLFPGYVFCKFHPSSLVPILNTPGVIDIVRAGRTLLTVDEREIDNLKVLVSSGLQSEPWPYLEVGQHVRIQSGPLSGREGLLVEVGRTPRLVLSITLLQRSVLVEIDREWVALCAPAVRSEPGVEQPLKSQTAKPSC